jgi:hypothetical protein
MSELPNDLATRPIHVRGADRPFGGLTLEDVTAHADELRAVTGWGPTARVASIARAWRELATLMQRSGATTVGDLGPEVMAELAPRLWVAPRLL